jgi:hypothetical protein
MNYFQSLSLIVLGIIAYIMILDENVGVYLTLIFKIIGINIKRFYWMIQYHPNNFITTWIQNRKYDQIAKELQQEFEQRSI